MKSNPRPLFARPSWRVLCCALRAGSWGLWIAGAAVAQAQSGNVLPEALKNIKPATGACLRDDAPSAQAGGEVVVEGAPPDLLCAIDPLKASALYGQPEVVWVDVRSATDYVAFRINGALNMSVSELRTKSFLRGKTIVLVGNGKAERELYAACADLKMGGFSKVLVLHGGITSWSSRGQELTQALLGQPPDVENFARLAASELWTESQFDANLVLVTRNQEEMQRHLPYAMLIRDDSEATVMAMLERRRKALKNAPLAAVVLVTAPGTSVDTLKRLRQAIQPIPLLVYTDTLQAYTQQVAQQKAIWVAQMRGPKKVPCGL